MDEHIQIGRRLRCDVIGSKGGLGQIRFDPLQGDALGAFKVVRAAARNADDGVARTAQAFDERSTEALLAPMTINFMWLPCCAAAASVGRQNGVPIGERAQAAASGGDDRGGVVELATVLRLQPDARADTAMACTSCRA